MRNRFLLITILFFIATDLMAQDCDSMLSYSKDDKYSIFLTKVLTGKVQNNPTDSLHGVMCNTSYFKTPNSTGINLTFYFIRCGRMMDNSVKVKVEFMDGSTIFLSNSSDDYSEGELGIFFFLAGGDYGHNYELTMLRTKSISKISISGNQIDSYTYNIKFSDSIDFMLGMECLWKLTK